MSELDFHEVSVVDGYALWAGTYDQEKNGLIYLEEKAVARMLGPLTFSTVLDVGAGTGRHALRLAWQGADVSAVDQSPEMLAVAKAVAARESLSIDFQIHSLDADLPFEAGQFDLVICALTLCHVRDLNHAVRELARVLKDGGSLVITDFHPDHVIYGWKAAFQHERVMYNVPTMGHTKAGYLDAIRASGLTLVEVIESIVGEAPHDYLPEDLRRDFSDKPFCLSVLARK